MEKNIGKINKRKPVTRCYQIKKERKHSSENMCNYVASGNAARRLNVVGEYESVFSLIHSKARTVVFVNF